MEREPVAKSVGVFQKIGEVAGKLAPWPREYRDEIVRAGAMGMDAYVAETQLDPIDERLMHDTRYRFFTLGEHFLDLCTRAGARTPEQQVVWERAQEKIAARKAEITS